MVLSIPLELINPPNPFVGQGRKVIQIDPTEGGVEFGQKLGPLDNPAFMILAVEGLNCSGDVNVGGGLLIEGEAIFSGTLDANGALNVVDNNITIGNVGFPTGLTADGGGLTLLDEVGGSKTFLWLNATSSWTLNQQLDVGVNKIVNVVDPVSAQDAATKKYVDDQLLTQDAFLELVDTPSSYSGEAGSILQVKGATSIEFGQKLRTTDSPTFGQVNLGDIGLIVGQSIPFSDTSGVLTLQNVDALDAVTEATIEAAIDVLVNLSAAPSLVIVGSLDSGAITSGFGPIDVGASSITTTGSMFGGSLVLTGNLTVNGTTTIINSVTLSVDDKNIELGAVNIPTDLTADGGGITLLAGVDGDKTIKWLNATDRWTFNQGIDLLGNNLISTGLVAVDIVIAASQALAGNLRLSGNTLSSDNANGDIILAPNGTGKVAIGNLRLTSNTIEPLSGGSFRVHR